MKKYTCSCGNNLYFHNSRCLRCASEVGYEPMGDRMICLDANRDFVRCLNGLRYSVCNWVTPRNGPSLCPSCSLNRTIPNLASPRNRGYWADLELAKRRVLSTLAGFGLRPASRALRNDGVAFDFLSPWPGATVLTGHLNGIITINLLEADPAYREHLRQFFGEPQRSLVGHFRHEFGHYFWDQMFGPRSFSGGLSEWRSVFGDEREDYGSALFRYYRNGRNAGWQRHYLTPYASAHPWEDWAETWAIYLAMVDAAETARTLRCSASPDQPWVNSLAFSGLNPDDAFIGLVNGWLASASALPELDPAAGCPTLSALSFSPASLRKLYFVHSAIARLGRSEFRMAA